MLKTKKLVSLVFVLFVLISAAAAQQITRVAVMDLQKIYLTYFKDSQAVRALEESKAAVNEEIKRLGDEIKDLQQKRLEMLKTSDSASLKAFDDQLYRKAQYLSDYIKVKQAELEERAQNLSHNDLFAQKLYKTIENISEMEGFSLVISSRDSNSMGSSVIWFSPMIDITDKVIQALLGY